MTDNEYWDARSEYAEDAYQDALDKAREGYKDWLEMMDYTEDDYSFDEYLIDIQREIDGIRH